MNNDVPEIIVRVLQGEPAEKDMQLFLQWYHSSQENKKLFFQLKHIYDHRKDGDKPDGLEMEASWERLLQKIQNQSVIPHLPMKGTRNMNYNRIVRYVCTVAVSVLLIMVGIRFFHKGTETMEWIEVSTEAKSEPQTIHLSDGSVVKLNASSNFRYPEKFNGKSREVYLDGEACFTVSKAAHQPFIVFTDKQQINVLGTEFNVLAYSSDPYAITTLVSGKVKLGMYDKEKQMKEEIILLPNQQLYFDKELHQATLSQVNPSDALSWLNGVYSFRDATLEEIALRLEKIYGVTISIPEEAVRKEKYTGKFFSQQPINEIMNVINFKDQFRFLFNVDTISLQRKKGGLN